ncbi:MAG: vitamin B12 dependent-methionine synthase activation domain-containing protein, partial [Gallicola sp.]|nr:vitamin B12 dependent-methionine synthase activation domain-containing protein [Gallicola sp.]
PDERVDIELDSLIEEFKAVAKPKWIMREFTLKNLELLGTNLVLKGESIKKLLESCQSVVLFATTLGRDIETLLSRYSKSNISKAILADSVASAAIEDICEEIEYEIKVEKSKESLYLTDRFSPGYGDMDISQSAEICKVLDTERKIGLTTSNTGIMIPRKSVNAIIGISKENQSFRARGCGNCMMRPHCEFRKKGVVCYAT